MTSEPERLTARFSTFLGWARYDREARLMEIDFRDPNGAKRYTYAYPDFPAGEWDDFRTATNKAQHFLYRIRPRFTGRKVWWANESARRASA